MLPKDWKFDDETGEIEPPIGTKISMQEITQDFSDIPSMVIPTIPNLKFGRGLGGKGTSVIDYMQDSLDSNLNLSQHETTGILHVEEKHETGEVKNRYAFLPDKNNILQVDKTKVEPKLSTEQGCFYTVTTSQGQQVKVLPTVKDPTELSQIIENGQLIFGEYGEVFMEVPNKTRASISMILVMSSSYVESNPEDWCITDADTGELVCDTGVIIDTSNNTNSRGRTKQARIVYSDGTSQKLMPTVYKPDIFIEQALTFAGVDDIIFNVDGTFTVTYNGEKYSLIPDFNTRTKDVPIGKTVKPELAFNKKGGITYKVGIDLTSDSTTQQMAMMFDLSIDIFTEESCKVN